MVRPWHQEHRQRVCPIPPKLPERSHPRAWAKGRGIGHFTHQLPKMVAPTLPSPSARMHPRGGEGQGRSPPHERAPGTGAKMELEAEIKGGEGGEVGEDAPRLATA